MPASGTGGDTPQESLPCVFFVEFLRSMSSAGKIAFGAIREPDLHP